jgi:hypothetical protein
MNIPMDSKEPVLIRGGASRWPAARWTFRTLGERGGTKLVPIAPTKYKRLGEKVVRAGKNVAVSVKDFMADLDAGRPCGHLNGSDLLNVVPGLREEIAFPDMGVFHFDTVWIGPTGNETPIHFDKMPNVFSQIVGQKRWRLWHPDRPIARASWTGPGYRFSKLKVDEAVAPDFDFLLEPGDMLVVPNKWWHHVLTVEASVSVNRWWALPRLGRAISRVLPAAAVRRVFEFIRDVQMKLIEA